MAESTEEREARQERALELVIGRLERVASRLETYVDLQFGAQDWDQGVAGNRRRSDPKEPREPA